MPACWRCSIIHCVIELPANPRVRFAPSPTGALHVGNLRTALFNFLIARKYGGTFILRLEDTDRTRSRRMFEEEIEAGLAMLDMIWDEGPGVGGVHAPYYQSRRTEFYTEAVERLLTEGHAYRCFCSMQRVGEVKLEQRKGGKPPRYDRACLSIPPEEAERRALAGETHVVRFRLPDEREVVVDDLLHGRITIALSALEDFIIRKSNGDFTFDLPNVVDDADMQISLVVRGEEHITNTARHMLLRRALGVGEIPCLHLPLILDRNRRKLSKRAGAVTLREFVQLGVLPRAIINSIALLGWHPKGEREIYSMPDLVKAFSVERLSRSPAVFDPDRLEYFHREHLKLTTFEKAEGRFRQHLSGLNPEGAVAVDREALTRLIFQEVVDGGLFYSKAADLFSFIDSDFAPPASGELAERRETLEEFARFWTPILAEQIAGKPEETRVLLSAFVEEHGVGRRELLHPLRLALTGRSEGVSIYLVLALLFPEVVAQRIRQGLEASATAAAGAI